MVLIDGIIFSLQRQGGISVYFRALIEFLAKEREETSLVVDGFSKGLHEFDIEAEYIYHQKPRLFERYRPCRTPVQGGVFHSSYYRVPEKSRIPAVVTVHDFIYERYQRGPRKWVHTLQKNAAIRSAQAVICISESTKQDFIEFVGEIPGQKIHVIHNGVDKTFRNLSLSHAGAPFVLFVGQRSGYKNFSLVLASLVFLPDLQLYCVGGGQIHAEELKGVPDSVARRVRHMGYVSDKELNVLYNRAVCLVYPSSYEGFGIPVIEAMRAGCPVVSADCKAVLEVGLDALTVVSGTDPRVMADAILKTASSERACLIQRGLVVASGYSWEATHRQTLAVYRSLGA